MQSPKKKLISILGDSYSQPIADLINKGAIRDVLQIISFLNNLRKEGVFYYLPVMNKGEKDAEQSAARDGKQLGGFFKGLYPAEGLVGPQGWLPRVFAAPEP